MFMVVYQEATNIEPAADFTDVTWHDWLIEQEMWTIVLDFIVNSLGQ
jgi:hypothetical protein